MNRLLLSGLALVLASFASPAFAQATRTWVSGVGDDANPCSRTAPCATFAGTISKTATNGEINCLDPGSFGAINITKAITIDCHDISANILVASAVAAVTINAPTNANVTLRNLAINGMSAGTRGVSILQGSRVFLENVQIYGFTQQGVADVRTNPGSILVVRKSTIRNNTGAGIAIAAAATSGSVVEHVTSTQNGYGIAAGAGNNVIVSHSVFTNNTSGGVLSDPGAIIHLEDSTVSHHNTGIISNGPVRLSRSNIAFNTTAFSGGAISTNGNNQVFGNTSLGSSPSAAGPVSTDLGLQ